nr:PQQ-dependent sugar dehydrogenase [Streptomyces sp. MSC1_001]
MPALAASHAAAAPQAVNDATADQPVLFDRVPLASGAAGVGEPMSLAILPDGRILHTSRREKTQSGADGVLRITTPQGVTKESGRIPVYDNDEEGLQSIAVDPGFVTNRFVYLYYAPVVDKVNRLSRFVLRADGTLDTASEKKILDVAADRGVCCHVGGDIDFDAAGNLYLTTGDDTLPFNSNGYSPLKERPVEDAQRTAGNTNDLRGKILRIKVAADGSVSYPAGNMFAPGTPGTRPEIYAMGFRNPFRMSVDKKTGAVYLGDYGPDAPTTDPNRGPAGQVEFNRVTEPGFYGWPYCTGSNTTAETYNAFNFTTGVSGPKFDCAGGPTNNSPNNSGLKKLPPAKPAWIKYDGCSVNEFCPIGSDPALSASLNKAEAPMGGPIYHYDPDLQSPVKFPQSFDGKFIAAEFGRRWINAIGVNPDGSRGTITPVEWGGTQIIDMAFGPDGALYVLDYGTEIFKSSPQSALYRLEPVYGGRAPIAQARADRTNGKGPLPVAFTSAGSKDPENGALTYTWDFGDGTSSSAPDPTHTYTANGQYNARLTVTDPDGKAGSQTMVITVGNTAPSLNLILPADGQLFSFGDTLSYRVTGNDPEDGAIDCSKVVVHYVLGHDSHGHQMNSSTGGCSGTLQTVRDNEHGPEANIYGSWIAEYTDGGANGQPALGTQVSSTTQSLSRQAEHFTNSKDVRVGSNSAARGGSQVGSIANGDWIAFDPYLLKDVASFTARVASPKGGTIELRAGSENGPLIGSVTVPITGSWSTYQETTTTLSSPPLTPIRLYLVFKGGSGDLFNLDEFSFTPPASATGPVTGLIKGIGGKCVDVQDSASKTPIQLLTCTGAPAQDWTTPGDGTVRTLGKCMDVAAGGTRDGTKVWLWNCNGSGAQQWAWRSDGTLFNPQSGKVLDTADGSATDSTGLVIRGANGDVSQSWTLT